MPIFAQHYSAFFAAASLLAFGDAISVDWYTSSRDGIFSLTERDPISFDSMSNTTTDAYTIIIDENVQFQKIFGIGNSLEASSCYNLMRMDAVTRSETLEKILDPVKGIGMSLMRVTMATSDFCPLPFYSYDDMPAGESDVSMAHFSIARDQDFILPVLREAASKYTSGDDGLRFFASSWSPPAWMKTSGKLEGGQFDTSHFDSYSQYILRFLQAYEKEGIHIAALTPQNEPLQNEETYPTTYLPPNQEADLIRNYLGPLLKQENVSTDVWCFDHNFNTLFYPEAILGDPATAQYVAGTAFHNYGGQPSAMSELHELYPDKDIFFSEGSTFGVRCVTYVCVVMCAYNDDSACC